LSSRSFSCASSASITLAPPLPSRAASYFSSLDRDVDVVPRSGVFPFAANLVGAARDLRVGDVASVEQLRHLRPRRRRQLVLRD